MRCLNITPLCAETSQAKGRVERAHLTLQDRLVKELRLKGISTIEAANAFAEEYMADYNRRFAKAPLHDFNAHRSLTLDDDLDAEFTWREPRRVSKNLTVQYDKMLYLIEDSEYSRRAIGKYIDVWHYPDGHKELRLNGILLPYSTYDTSLVIAVLVQIDGSPHDWFEGRAPKCCLLVFIDDATGRLMHFRFGETESAFDYMLATREYIGKHGKPLAFYSDKHGIFRVNHASGSKAGTQFGRVLHDIGVELICANSPQAKGRVERANKTLQDRLIKEMRLNKISSIEEANAWLETFIVDFNRRFAKTPKYQ